MRHRYKCIPVLLLLLTLTGCWDRVEIEERGFVIGVGIDLPEKVDEENENSFILTQQLVVPGALAGGSSNLGGGGASGDAYLNITSTGKSMFGIIRETSAMTSRTPFYEHNALIIISEELGRTKYFSSILDHFLRYHEMRRGMKVMISEGKAEDVLRVEPKNERLPALYIDSISINNFKNARMLPVSRIGDINAHLLKDESFTVQRILKKENEVKIAGNAVIKGNTNTFVGFLNEDETMGLNFLTGEIQGGVLEFDYRNGQIIFDIKKNKTKVVAHVSNENEIEFTITVESEGNIAEAFNTLNEEYDSEMMSQIEKEAADEIERYMNLTINKLQNEYKTDVIELGSRLKQNHPNVWDHVKEDWEEGKELFSKVKINTIVEVNMNQPGTLLKSNEREF
ncbi:Ger(x)C family spore germination protein [Cytobacillus suaedae]|nr:Ger(x)C family spore germination protein [Cytobacillus suaedae]